LLVGEGPVDLSRVEEVDAELQGPLDRRLGFLGVRLAVEGGHAHAAEADLRDFQFSELALLHLCVQPFGIGAFQLTPLPASTGSTATWTWRPWRASPSASPER